MKFKEEDVKLLYLVTKLALPRLPESVDEVRCPYTELMKDLGVDYPARQVIALATNHAPRSDLEAATRSWWNPSRISYDIGCCIVPLGNDNSHNYPIGRVSIYTSGRFIRPDGTGGNSLTNNVNLVRRATEKEIRHFLSGLPSQCGEVSELIILVRERMQTLTEAAKLLKIQEKPVKEVRKLKLKYTVVNPMEMGM